MMMMEGNDGDDDDNRGGATSRISATVDLPTSSSIDCRAPQAL